MNINFPRDTKIVSLQEFAAKQGKRCQAKPRPPRGPRPPVAA